MLRNKATKKGWHVNGTPVRFAQETGPARRALAKEFFQALDWIKAKQVPPESYVVCEKGLRLHLPVTWAILGEVPRNATKWEWNTASCRAIHFNPNDGLRWEPPAGGLQAATAGREGSAGSTTHPPLQVAAAEGVAVDQQAPTPDLRRGNTELGPHMQLG